MGSPTTASTGRTRVDGRVAIPADRGPSRSRANSSCQAAAEAERVSGVAIALSLSTMHPLA